jgi:hypothetical protein
LDVAEFCGWEELCGRRRRLTLKAVFYHGAVCGFGQLNLNLQAQSVCSRSEVLEVIDFRLEQVITPSGFVLQK